MTLGEDDDQAPLASLIRVWSRWGSSCKRGTTGSAGLGIVSGLYDAGRVV